MLRFHLLLVTCLAATAAVATPAGRPLAPLDAAASVAAPVYDSAFASYRKYEEPAVADWKQTNAAVAGEPGHAGHAGHANHAADSVKADPQAGHDMAPMTAAKPAAAPKSKTPAKPDPHAAHKH